MRDLYYVNGRSFTVTAPGKVYVFPPRSGDSQLYVRLRLDVQRIHRYQNYYVQWRRKYLRFKYYCLLLCDCVIVVAIIV